MRGAIVRTRISLLTGHRGRLRGTVCGAVVALSLAVSGCQEQKAAPPAAPPEVMVTPVTQQDVPIRMELVGQTKGSQDVDIRARVEGFLEAVSFTEGSIVRKGQVLYRIDPKSFEAALTNAKADLATAQARLAKTTNDVNRYRPLVAQQAVSQQELDNAVSAQTAAQAQVEAQKAKVEQEQIDLGYTTVTSPIDGLVGTTQVKTGNLVGRGEATLLTTISELDPILFRAGLSEAEYLRLSRRAEELKKERGGAAVPITLVLADGTEHPYPGRLDVIERAVDAATGTLTIQFKFPNPGGLLRPGQYGRAQFILETRKGALLVPQRAVQEVQNLYSVAVVGSDNKVQFRNVTVGPRVGSLWLIADGLKPGERVVVEGMQRVRDGAPVTPKDAPPSSAGSGTPEPAAAMEGK
jgi:membrane fusion protein (multidrug efflux system)